MSDDELKAIFAYLKSVKPINHYVDNLEPPTMSVVCNAAHGGGDKNQKNWCLLDFVAPASCRRFRLVHTEQ
jgi:hypothetical protein